MLTFIKTEHSNLALYPFHVTLVHNWHTLPWLYIRVTLFLWQHCMHDWLFAHCSSEWISLILPLVCPGMRPPSYQYVVVGTRKSGLPNRSCSKMLVPLVLYCDGGGICQWVVNGYALYDTAAALTGPSWPLFTAWINVLHNQDVFYC